jgi:2-polyprenyl-3-methyl-5-hydroxy-6-metoxy-1,4-benzoquinol methylase
MKTSKLAQGYINFSARYNWMPPKILLFARAVWLGILNADELNEITRFGYEHLWDFWSEEFNIQQGLWPWEAEVIQRFFLDSQHVLLAGAGGGREVIALTQLGLTVTAFDFSENLVEACLKNLKKSGLHADVYLAPAENLPTELHGKVFDRIILGRGFYHHIPEQRRRIEFLKNCSNHLETHSHLYISDFFTRQPNSRGLKITKFVADIFRRLRQNPSRVELGDWLSHAMQHAFVQDEIESEVREAGLLMELYAIPPFGPESQLAYLIARKP